MKFSNVCFYTLEDIDDEHGLLVKVPAPNRSQKNKYFYISNEENFNKLNCCPFTKRKGICHTIKLSNLAISSGLLKEGTENELIDDTGLLDEITKKFKWEKRSFEFTFNAARNESFLYPRGWAICVALGGAYLTLIGQNIFGAEYVRNPENIEANYSGAMWIGMISAVSGGIEYFVRRSSSNAYGFFTYPGDRIFEAAFDRRNDNLRRL